MNNEMFESTFKQEWNDRGGKRPTLGLALSGALERLIRFLLDPAHLVDRRTGVSNDVKLVKRDPGVGQMLADPRDEGRRHADAGAGDVLRRAAMFLQVGGQFLSSLMVLASRPSVTNSTRLASASAARVT
jgi:hypothetical protein